MHMEIFPFNTEIKNPSLLRGIPKTMRKEEGCGSKEGWGNAGRTKDRSKQIEGEESLKEDRNDKRRKRWVQRNREREERQR